MCEGDRNDDRRFKSRKTTSEVMPVSVQVVDATSEELKAMRRQPRKSPPHQMRVACFHDIVDEATVVDMSEHGIRMRGKTNFEVGQKLNLSFLVPDQLTEKQVPIFAICEVIWCKKYDQAQTRTGLSIFFMPSDQASQFSAFLEKLPEINGNRKSPH